MKPSIVQPILLIILGALWLLKSTALLPETSILLALLLAAAGVILGLLDGLTKSTVVSSPMLVYAGAAIYLYDHYFVRFSHVAAFGMMLLGILLLLARSDRIPERRLPRRRT
ncbi:hypothetical protein [Vogesella sp. LIG4]|uniref:hypothetical protein n=1 Tax=Vogesella sp. LIG4 TaxID=1192162 RepID=UPI00081FCCEB|nr:hypothetical protein [Vogesella sp. LIG4]SCK05735.1 hypothetical protein PSELUDRAFT_0157 [Vogesella sp. LIG4]